MCNSCIQIKSVITKTRYTVKCVWSDIQPLLTLLSMSVVMYIYTKATETRIQWRDFTYGGCIHMMRLTNKYIQTNIDNTYVFQTRWILQNRSKYRIEQ